jgi:TonB family protein
MKPEDAGSIRDAGLRQSIRDKHMGQIEDGFRMFQIALQIDPDYADAMACINLPCRIAAGLADSDARYAEPMAQGEGWVSKAIAAKRKSPPKPPPPRLPPDLNRSTLVAPPPPPPPPPRPAAGGDDKLTGTAPERIRIEGSTQQAMLLKQTPPVYPASARSAGVAGAVQLGVQIGKDGTIENVKFVSGPAELADAAMEAVRQWRYRPALLNGQPVKVVTTVIVNFAPGQ